jgi:hypothetical protein
MAALREENRNRNDTITHALFVQRRTPRLFRALFIDVVFVLRNEQPLLLIGSWQAGHVWVVYLYRSARAHTIKPLAVNPPKQSSLSKRVKRTAPAH